MCVYMYISLTQSPGFVSTFHLYVKRRFWVVGWVGVGFFKVPSNERIEFVVVVLLVLPDMVHVLELLLSCYPDHYCGRGGLHVTGHLRGLEMEGNFNSNI